MNVLYAHIRAVILGTTGNSISLGDLFNALTGDGVAISVPELTAAVEAMEVAGAVAYDDVTGVVSIGDAEGAYTVPTDPEVPANVTAALQALSDALGGVQVADFLADIRADGLDAPNAVVGMYMLEHLALIVAARRTDERLRAPAFAAIRIVGKLRELLEANPA
jgi:hypothetical protein